ncbi:putative quinol monooxygenase [Phytoactinopolyspora endophytica]|uniref:putative quinol monooxygenase n=1 Tax=Phytoactinopolyspora endophytica TaxID=1642495 RepID=UPI00101D6A6C|nr:putative quinol monooxygenase [Phytoactinopolyspora endophytica]
MAHVVVAHWRARPGSEAEVRAVIHTMTALTRQESGCLQFQAQESTSEPGTFLLYEQYTSAAAVDEHRATPHFVEHVLGRAVSLLEHRSAQTYETIDV